MAEAIARPKKRHTDMTKGPIAKTLFFFTLPMFLGNLFQQLYNMVDSIVVGNFVGPSALGAVGCTFPIVFVAIAVASGLGMGCSVVTSQYLGAKDYGSVRMSVTTSLIFNLVVSIALSILGMAASGTVLKWMRTSPETIDMATEYLFIYFLGLTFMFMYNTIAGTFRALGDSKTPLYYLILSSFLNIGLDLLFVIQFGMGVAGVAWATMIAQGVCAVFSFIHLMNRLGQFEKRADHRVFSTEMLRTIVRLAIPSMLQQLSVSISSVLCQTVINGFGPMLVSGYTAANKIESIAGMPIMNLGMAVSTFVAQNIGAGKMERVKKGFKSALIMVLIFAAASCVLLLLFGPNLVGIFVNREVEGAAEVINWGTYHLVHMAFILFIQGLMFTGEGMLKGAGDMNLLVFCTLTGMVLRTICVFALAPKVGFAAIWFSIGLGSLTEVIIAFWRYFQGGWKEKAIVSDSGDEAPEETGAEA